MGGLFSKNDKVYMYNNNGKYYLNNAGQPIYVQYTHKYNSTNYNYANNNNNRNNN